MPIITIYQGASGSGDALAQQVADDLGYRCVGREVLREASQRFDIPEAKLNKILEREPNWWERWLENLRPYRIALQAAMCSVAQEGNIVYHGHMGHELFPGIRHVLKVMLTAPLEYRIDQVRSRQQISEEAARKFVEEVDKARRGRIKALFETDLHDPSRYDLVLNMQRIGLETARGMIVQVARLDEFQPTAASEQDFQNLTLAATVQSTLVMKPEFRNLGIDVIANKGAVKLTGVLFQWAAEEEIVNIVKGIPGVVS
ncbi:MAG: BON domain-containing protein, partial [Deltaproteobacteria bacterium]|nr:BON domain-containing protein [Deltaproteobacteria bacterium]